MKKTLISLILLSLTNTASAEIYTWEDEQGGFHATDRIEEAPPNIQEKYLSQKQQTIKPKIQIPVRQPQSFINRDLPTQKTQTPQIKINNQTNTSARKQVTQSLIQPSVFAPILRLLTIVAIMFIIMILIVTLTVKYLNPKYKDSSLLDTIISLWLSNNRQEKRQAVTYIVKNYNIRQYNTTEEIDIEPDNSNGNGIHDSPFKKLDLLSPAEIFFLENLRKAINDEFDINCQVALNRIIGTIKEKDYKYWNKISQKSVDFTVCNKRSQAVLLVIELDDKLHFRHDRKKRDKEVNEILARQQIPILHIPVKPLYDIEKLKKDIYAKIQPSSESEKTQTQSSNNKSKFCTAFRCNGIMTVKTYRSGQNVWVCNDCGNEEGITEARA